MNQNQRLSLMEDAFLRPPTKVGPYTLRPLSATSYILLKRVKNLLATDEPSEGPKEITIDSPEGMAAIFGFIYAHAAPLDDVLRAARDPQDFDDAVLRFSAVFPPQLAGKAWLAITGQMESAKASVAEVEPPEDNDDEEGDDPNGRGRRGSRTASSQSRPKRVGKKSS